MTKKHKMSLTTYYGIKGQLNNIATTLAYEPNYDGKDELLQALNDCEDVLKYHHGGIK